MTEKPTMASRLPLAARKRAVNFILEKGNNLQRMRYAFHFADGGADSVLGALRESDSRRLLGTTVVMERCLSGNLESRCD